MQAGDNCRSGLSLFSKNIQHVQLVLRIQVIGRFVQQIDGRCLRKRLSDREATPLATRQSSDVPVLHRPQVHLLQGVLRDILVFNRFPL